VSHRLEFFFDCSSPWTYLGFHQIIGIASMANLSIDWRPILVGGVFNTINPGVYEQRANPVPAKARYYRKDLADWALHLGLAIGQPPVFPVNSVKAMRGCLVAADEGKLEPFARAVFESYWGHLEDISREDVLERAARGAGLEPQSFFRAIGTPEIKARLRTNTDELIERGGFGSPTFFLDGDDMFFGNDRLPLLRARLGLPPG